MGTDGHLVPASLQLLLSVVSWVTGKRPRTGMVTESDLLLRVCLPVTEPSWQGMQGALQPGILSICALTLPKPWA